MSRRPLTAEQQARVAEQREQRVQELQDQIQQGVTALISAQGWQQWLSFMSRFRQYSLRNQILILQQMPTATQVAGYKTWQAAGRQVRRGEKAIAVLGPMTRKLTDDNGNLQLDDNGQPKIGVFGFKALPVFDISQTDGPPPPIAPQAQQAVLQGEAPEGMWQDLTEFIHSRGFTVGLTPTLGGPEGVTRFGPQEVLIVEGQPAAHAASVLAHEAGHVLMHQPAQDLAEFCRGVVEVEAESFAHVVAAEHGLDSSATSFDYLAGWAASAARARNCTPEDIIVETAERVRAAVITYLDRHTPATDAPHPVGAHTLQLRDRVEAALVQPLDAQTVARSPRQVHDRARRATPPVAPAAR